MRKVRRKPPQIEIVAFPRADQDRGRARRRLPGDIRCERCTVVAPILICVWNALQGKQRVIKVFHSVDSKNAWSVSRAERRSEMPEAYIQSKEMLASDRGAEIKRRFQGGMPGNVARFIHAARKHSAGKPAFVKAADPALQPLDRARIGVRRIIRSG